MQKEFPEYYDSFRTQFEKLCLKQQECHMLIQNVKWPEPCLEKIGFRLEVVTIANEKLVDISE